MTTENGTIPLTATIRIHTATKRFVYGCERLAAAMNVAACAVDGLTRHCEMARRRISNLHLASGDSERG